MKLYKVRLHNNETSSDGFQYFASEREAQKCIRDYRNNFLPEDEMDCSGCKITRITITPTRKGIIAALNEHGSHNDNG